MARRRRRGLPLLQMCAAALGLLALSTVAVPSWAGELAASWMPHIAIGLLAMAVGALLLRRRLWALVQTALAACLVVAMVPAGADSAQAMARSTGSLEGERLRLVFANVYRHNDDLAALADWIAAQGPDVVVMTEVMPPHMAALDGEFDAFAWRIEEPRDHAFGQVVLSRLPFVTWRILELDGRSMTPRPVYVAVGVAFGDHTVRIAGFHPYPPHLPRYAEGRNAQYREVADLLEGTTGPTVVVGDFNATAWSPELRGLARSAMLTGFNLSATWPAALSFAGIGIDHVLVGEGVAIAALTTGPRLGSDHRAIVVDLVVRPQGSPGTP